MTIAIDYITELKNLYLKIHTEVRSSVRVTHHILWFFFRFVKVRQLVLQETTPSSMAAPQFKYNTLQLRYARLTLARLLATILSRQVVPFCFLCFQRHVVSVIKFVSSLAISVRASSVQETLYIPTHRRERHCRAIVVNCS